MHTIIRPIVYAGNTLLGIIVVATYFPNAFLLTQISAAIAFLLLYLTLLVSPLYHVFPNMPGLVTAKKAKKAMGISSFAFSLLHTTCGYITMGGIGMLTYYGPMYRWSLLFGATAFGILLILAFTSIKVIHKTLGIWWKRIHRFVYAAAYLILFHTFTITTHLGSKEYALSIISFILISFLCILQSVRFNSYVYSMYNMKGTRVAWAGSIFSVAILYWAFFIHYHPH